uniref:Uncharacterized protein n=1 Tax=Anguilla anguilla TaxID=7936 RepID=A0A0E9TT87_ANGAN
MCTCVRYVCIYIFSCIYMFICIYIELHNVWDKDVFFFLHFGCVLQKF